MKQKFRTARNILAVLMAVLLTALTASVAVVAEDIDVNVQFVNNYATKAINPATDLTEYKDEVVKVLSVPQNTVICVSAEGAPEGAVLYDATPERRKDEAKGEYKFLGWTTTPNPGEDAPVQEFPFVATADTTFYAKFEGLDVTYSVDFRSNGIYVDAEGNLQPDIIQVPVIDEKTGEQKKDPSTGEPIFTTELNTAPRPAYTVEHGGSVPKPSKDPGVIDSGHYEFHFVKWDYDNTQIFKNGSINAVYEMVGKTYKFRFRDYDGTLLGERNIVYGSACTDVPSVAQRDFSTKERQYSFHDEWNLVQNGLQTGTGKTINMSDIEFNEAPVDEEGFINVYAQYWEQLKEYYFTLHVIDSDGYAAEGVGVQVQGPENQLLNTFRDETLGHNGGVGTTDRDGNVTLSVPYAEYYIISAYDPYYNLAVQVRKTVDDIKDNKEISLQLGDPTELNKGQQRCNDVCHSFIGGLWITGLNLFYRLFNVKYVCCYDMYATHGDKLAYAAGSSGRTIDRS